MRIDELISQDLPIVHEHIPIEEAEALYEKHGYHDKLALLRTRPRLYVSVYSLGGVAGYFFGALATSTGALHLFDLRRYYDGIYLGFPRRNDPTKLEHMIPQEKMFEVFAEYKQWADVMGVPSIGYLNHKILAGEGSELIKVAEALSEKKFGALADTIAEANRERGVRLVLISGPSSSGKTTSAKRLGIQLKILGLTPVLISLDDYFVERDKTPLGENGKPDYEALEALDLEAFNSDLVALFAGKSVNIPSYDFITGRRKQHDKPLQLDDRSILVVEGIHGLNPRLTEKIDDSNKFRIYISAFTSIAMDNLSRIPTTDNRLIRRMVRDYSTRGSNALNTLKRWGSVRRGEEKHIFPYQENADVMFNSAMFYEISVLKQFVEPLLHTIPNTEPEYGEARRLLKLIDNFIPIDPEEIPPTSILREFIGGSSFNY
jgi:uridine kinase